MPAKSPQPTRSRDDEALAQTGTKTPAFGSTMASIRKALVTPSPAGTAATEAMTPMTVSPEPPTSISFVSPSSQTDVVVPDDARQSQSIVSPPPHDEDDEDMRTPNDREWQVRALFIGEKNPLTEQTLRRHHSYQESETYIPPLPPRASLGSFGESESSMHSSVSMRKSSRSRRRSRSHRSSKSLEEEDWSSSDFRASDRDRRRSSSTSFAPAVISPDDKALTDSTATTSSAECSPDVSPTRTSLSRQQRKSSRMSTSPVPEMEASGFVERLTYRIGRLRTTKLMCILFLVGFLSLGFTVITSRAVLPSGDATVAGKNDEVMAKMNGSHQRSGNPQAGGLRGKLVQNVRRNRPKDDHGKDAKKEAIKDKKEKKETTKDNKKEVSKKDAKNASDKKDADQKEAHKNDAKEKAAATSKISKSDKTKQQADRSQMTLVVLAPSKKIKLKQSFNSVDPKMFDRDAKSKASTSRVVYLHDSIIEKSGPVSRHIKVYPSDFTDNTQLYGVLDSDDGRLAKMERREPYSDKHCVPMQDWQTTFHPSCNGMHEMALDHMGSDTENDFNLFGTKGFWRNAWRVDVLGDHHRNADRETVVLKTLKFQHNFEDAHFEHDRIDAVAMERLTASPHVINVFGFCGHSVVTEYAEGTRVGSLADKAKKEPLARLKIARDIANGLADVHGIDGDGNATFVHLDINPANVVSIGGTLKLNDFNIGIIRQWNVTSNKPCGFPAQYPNPQWRSPEEARKEQNLTEKVDVFSMGHIFFRLICGHEPWNKLEPGERPTKEEVNAKVKKGVLPHIPEEVMNTSDEEEIAIRDAMLSCYNVDPSKRPSARDIANSLQSTLDRLSAMQSSDYRHS